MKDKCSECNRNATRMEFTEYGRAYYCARHCPPFVGLKRDYFEKLIALADAVQAYLTAKPDAEITSSERRPTESAAYEAMAHAFQEYRPEVIL